MRARRTTVGLLAGAAALLAAGHPIGAAAGHEAVTFHPRYDPSIELTCTVRGWTRVTPEDDPPAQMIEARTTLSGAGCVRALDELTVHVDWNGTTGDGQGNGEASSVTTSGRDAYLQVSAPFSSEWSSTTHYVGFRCADGTVCAFVDFDSSPAPK